MTALRVLLVEDDDPHARLVVERLRESAEIEVVARSETLASALAQLSPLASSAFDAVLLDLGLPDSEGVEGVRAIHLAAPRLPIVVLSGQRDLGLAIEAMRNGAQDYVLKSSSDAANLGRALRLAIERKRLQDVEQLLVGVVSHDLRGPLQTIALAAEMLIRESPTSRHAFTIRRTAARAATLVDDLLDATRARLSGVLPIGIREVELVGLVQQVVDDARVAHPGRTIELAAPAQLAARVDPERLAQVAQNLLGNALQHSPPTSVVEVALRSDHDQLELEFHNVGDPIRPELRDRIFEPLERGSSSTRDRHGIGLGLFIVAEIVRAHRGTIRVESDAVAGTTFCVRLPVNGPAGPP